MNSDENFNHSSDDDDDDDDVEFTSETDHGGCIIPKQTCEHVQYVQLSEEINPIDNNQCIDCESTNENWLCLSCSEIHCSRYINNHGEGHWLFTLLTDEQDNIGHCLTISLQDLSVWCYPCNSYVKNIRLNPLIKQLETIKFGLSSIDKNLSYDTKNNIISKQDTQTPSTIIAIQDASLLKALKKTDLLSYCYTTKFRSASIEELVCLHSSDYVNMLVSAEKTHTDITDTRFHIQYNDTTLSNARLSAAITIDVVKNVVQNNNNGMILSTSPGHRALHDHGNGTSIYNNIALAVNAILLNRINLATRRSSLALIDSNNHLHMEGATPIEDAICHMIHVLSPSTMNDNRRDSQISNIIDKNNNKIELEHVLIVDLTSEHGCGIQSIYYESNQVCYVSIHKENHQHKSSYHECGKNEGLGYTINIPLSSIDKIHDRDYINIVNELLLPIAKEFQPELIIVCVDFHIQQITARCYAWIIEELSMICNKKLVVTLDGNLSNISSKTSYVQMVLSVLIGKLSLMNSEDWKTSADINVDVRQKIDLVKEKHKQYWSCFQ